VLEYLDHMNGLVSIININKLNIRENGENMVKKQSYLIIEWYIDIFVNNKR